MLCCWGETSAALRSSSLCAPNSPQVRGREVPFPVCLQRSMGAVREAGTEIPRSYLLSMQGLCMFLMWPNLESFYKKGNRHIPSRKSHPFWQISGPSYTCSKKPCIPLGSFQTLSEEKKLDELGHFCLHLASFCSSTGKKSPVFLEKEEKDKMFDWNFSPCIQREDEIYRMEIFNGNGRDLNNPVVHSNGGLMSWEMPNPYSDRTLLALLQNIKIKWLAQRSIYS